MLADEDESQDSEPEGSAAEDDFQNGNEEDSEIEDDVTKPEKKPKRKPIAAASDSDGSEKPNKKGVYKANKMNPIMYQDTVDKASKKI